MILTLDEFNLYLNDFNTDNDPMKTMVLKSAQEIVEQYLGYSLEIYEVTEKKYLVNTDFVSLREHVAAIKEISINEQALASNDIKNVYRNFVVFNAQYFGDLVIVYYSGFKAQVEGALFENNEDCPDSIKLAILQIAALKYMETGKRIGVTGMNTPDGVGTTFVNYTNYNKWLQAIAPYRYV